MDFDQETVGCDSKCEYTADLIQDFQSAMLSFLCSVSSKANVTMSNVFFIVDHVQELIKSVMECCCSSVKKMCIEEGLSMKNQNLVQLINEFMSFPLFMSEIGTKYKFEKYLNEKDCT